MNKIEKSFYRYILPKFITYLEKPTLDYMFIISSGRTGTTFLAKYFSDNFSKICSVHEPKININKLGQEFYLKKRGEESTKRLLLSYRWKLYKQIWNNECNVCIESNPSLALLIPLLKKVFNKPKIVVIVRNPVTYVRSAIDKTPKSQSDILFYSKSDELKRLRANQLRNDPCNELWETMTRFEKICWHWNITNNIIIDSLKCYDNYVLVKYEDIFNDPERKGIERIVNFFDLEERMIRPHEETLKAFQNKINSNKIYRLSENFAEWQKPMQNSLKIITSELSQKLGYTFY